MVTDVLGTQIPRFEQVTAGRNSRYDLGCLYIGTNDVRSPGFDREHFASQLDEALGFLAGRCDQTLTATIPLDMGRPHNHDRIEQTNQAIERTAANHHSLVLDLRRFAGRGVMMADHVHPTALGQVAIAELTLDLLAQRGAEIKARPSDLIVYRTTRWGRFRGDLTYAYRHAKQDIRLRLGAGRSRSE
jgi:hypothetical protein